MEINQEQMLKLIQIQRALNFCMWAESENCSVEFRNKRYVELKKEIETIFP